MIILPAIDIINHEPVRLYQGDYDKKEVVAQSVVDTARAFEQAGASWIHMVDLDAAKAGHPCNEKTILEAAKAVHIPVEAGGGIRTMADVAMYLENGIARVILGTAALEDLDFVKEAVERYGSRIAVGIDCKNGYACSSGWMKTSKKHYLELAQEMADLGVETIIFTDISKDGTLQGPNVEMLKKLQDLQAVNVIASGGIRDASHIEQLAHLGLYGAITGKAMYAGTLDLKEAIAIGEGHAQ